MPKATAKSICKILIIIALAAAPQSSRADLADGIETFRSGNWKVELWSRELPMERQKVELELCDRIMW